MCQLDQMYGFLLRVMYYINTFMNAVDYHVRYYKNHFLHEYGQTGFDNLGFMGTAGLTIAMMPVLAHIYNHHKAAAFAIGFIVTPRGTLFAVLLGWLNERNKFAAFMLILGSSYF